MEAPHCKLCLKRHYGLCAAGHDAGPRPARGDEEPAGLEQQARGGDDSGVAPRSTDGPEKKLKPDNSNIAEVVDQDIHDRLTSAPKPAEPSVRITDIQRVGDESVRPELRVVPPESDLMQRVVILEAMVMELLEARKKRSIYMKNYMREYRDRGG